MHLRNMRFVLFVVILCALTSICWGSQVRAGQTRILDVRLGVHAGSTRVVFECLGPRPVQTGPMHNATYPVRFQSLTLPRNWSHPAVPHGAILSRIVPPSPKNPNTFTLRCTRKDLWVEKAALKDDARPGHYRLILNLWPEVGPQSEESQSETNASRPTPRPTPEAEVIEKLPPGQKVPVHTDVVLTPEQNPASKGERNPQPATSVTGFRVGVHDGFTRVVVEAEGRRPQTVGEAVNGTLSIIFDRVAFKLPLPLVRRKLQGPVLGLRVQAKRLQFDVRQGTRTLKSFVIDTDPPRANAYRLVLDLAAPSRSQSPKAATGKKPGKHSRHPTTSQADRSQAIAAGRDSQPSLSTERSVRIGCVFGGSGPVLQEVLHAFGPEMGKLMDKGSSVQILAPDKWRCGWDEKRVKACVQAAVRDTALDVVLAFGPLAVAAASHVPKGRVPVVGITLFDVQDIGLSLNRDERSQVPGLSLVSLSGRMERDLQWMKRLFAPRRVGIVLPDRAVEAIPKLQATVKSLARKLGMEVTAVPAQDPKRLPGRMAGQEAVYLGPGLPWAAVQRREVFNRFKDQKIPAFSAAGRRDVQAGAAAGARPDIRIQMARRIALDVQEIMSGTEPSKLPVYVPIIDRLCINAKTAEHIGWDPGQTITMQAEVLPPSGFWGRSRKSPELSLEQAMVRAGKNQPQVAEAEAAAELAQAKSGQAASGMLPQIEGSLESRRIDRDRAEASLGLVPEAKTSGRITLRQMVFSDPVISTYRSSRHAAKNKALQAEATRLEAMFEAGKRYIDLLQARAAVQIQEENLRVTRKSLHLARGRKKAGMSGPEEVLRWETQEYTRQGALNAARARMEQARVALNQAMHTPMHVNWSLGRPDRKIWEHSVVHTGITPVVDSRPGLEAAADYGVRVATREAPELQALQEALKGAGIALSSKQRSLYVPEVGLEVQFEQVFDTQRPDLDFGTAGSPAQQQIMDGISSQLQAMTEEGDDQEWAAALKLSLPLFEGGSRRYEIRDLRAKVRKLEATRQLAQDRISQGVHSALFALSSALPEVSLSRKAADKAGKNLDIVQDKYARGQVSILELLDAQNQARVQALQASRASYAYVRDLLDLQRAMSWFECTKTDKEKQAWLSGLKRVLDK